MLGIRRRWQNFTQRVLPRQIRFTREGKYFFWITIGIGVAAINTGNNLLYLLLGMMLSLIIVSGILSNISLKHLEVHRKLPSRIFARTPCLITLAITNHKRYFPSFSIEIEDRIEGLQKGKKCYFLKLSPGREQKTAYRLELPHRGLARFQELRISTKFPFSLFVKSRRIPLTQEKVVFPQLSPIPMLPESGSLSSFGQQPRARRGHGINFFSLRDMQRGDEMRWVHWPSSARSGKLQVREFESEQRPQVSLLLWNALEQTPENSQFAREFDQAVNLTASLLVAFVQRGHPVLFATSETSFPIVSSPQQLEQSLHHLALLDAVGLPASPPFFLGEPLVLVPSCIAQPALPFAHRVISPPALPQS